MRNIRAIVFDFDLTLVDSAVAICMNLNALANEKSLRSLTIEEVRPTIGWALIDAMRSFWGDGPVESDWLPRYRQLFMERNYAGVQPFPETIPALNELRRRGVLMAVASNRLAPEGIVAAAGLSEFFPVIVGIENRAAKPDPAIVLEAIRQLNVPSEEAVYAGDTDIDMRTARNAQVFALGVASGNHSAEQLQAAGASCVIRTLAELPDVLEHF